MRPLKFSINVTLDGCCDHTEVIANEELHRHATASLDGADALLFGRVTYQMMESHWPGVARTGHGPPWEVEFARRIDGIKKYVFSTTLERLAWRNAELLHGDLGEAIARLKAQDGKGLLVGGLKLSFALAQLGLIDEYELLVQPIVAGHGPTLFQGLPERLDLQLVDTQRFESGVIVLRYVLRRTAPPILIPRDGSRRTA
jgi:dihydrofolate reductase